MNSIDLYNYCSRVAFDLHSSTSHCFNSRSLFLAFWLTAICFQTMAPLLTLLWTLIYILAVSVRSELVTYSTNELWSQSSITYRRPAWSKNVTIIYDETQIWSVSGIIVPISTSGRPSAPNPYNGYTTGTVAGLDKGH